MSSRRSRTKTAILDAAWKRLSSPGDQGRLEDIARDAGVTRQTLHLCFGTRSALLVALVHHIDQTLGLLDRIEEIATLSDPLEALTEDLRLTARYQSRIHGVAMALVRLAPTDPDAAAALEDRMRMRRAGLESLLLEIQRQGRLRSGWSVRQVTDILWEAGAPSSYQHLVVERGWSVDDFERWLLHLAASFVITE